jgi:flagellar M-ring protein FliF
LGETQSDKKVKYQVALQGELARTIQSLDKVKSARVHLVIPEPSLYSEDEEQPSASVAITTNENKTLSAKEVQGIINLVANSVEGLDPKNVVIVDHNGNLISDNLPEQINNSTDLVRQQMAMKKEYEQEEQAAIQSMLIAAESMNIGSVWLGLMRFFFQKEDEVRKLGIPEGYQPYYGVALGYKAEEKAQPAPKRNRDVVNYIS